MRCSACNILLPTISEEGYCEDCQSVLDIPEEKYKNYCLEGVQEGLTVIVNDDDEEDNY